MHFKPEIDIESLLASLADDGRSVLRRVFDAVPDAIVIHGPDGALLFCNQSAKELLGHTDEQLSNLKPFGWVGSDCLRGAADRLETILHEGQLSFDSCALRADGTTVPTEVASSRIDTSDGPAIIAVIRDVSERREAQRQLVHLAFHDALTGLPNRIAFEDRLTLAIADATRHGDILAVAYIDLDRFKPVNDRFGHETGDAVLLAIGQRLKETVRAQDMVCRLGGDEFIVLLPRLNTIDELPAVADRLLAVIRQPVEACGNDCAVDASIGFALFDSASDDVRSLVVKADVAMYQAKQDPGHRWRIWEPAMGVPDSTR